MTTNPESSDLQNPTFIQCTPQKETIKYTWTIKNFSFITALRINQFLYYMREKEKIKFRVSLFPFQYFEEDEHRSVGVCVDQGVPEPDAQLTYLPLKAKAIFRRANGDACRIDASFSDNTLICLVKRPPLLRFIAEHDILILDIEIKIPPVKRSAIRDPPDSLQPQLIADYKTMFLKQILTDVDFLVDLQIVRAHKFILATRSPFFLKLFSGDTPEFVINIDDTDYFTVYQLIYFIYCGRCKLDNRRATELLLVAAEKYEVKDLIKYCQKELSK